MMCENCRNQLSDYQRGEMDAASDAAIFEHLQSCVACQKELEAELALTESLRAALSTERDLPMAVIAGVRQAVRRKKTAGFFVGLRALTRPAVLAPTAAVLLLVAGILRYDRLHHAVNAPQLSANYYVRQHVAQTMDARLSDRAWSGYLLTTASDEHSNAPAP